MQAISIMTYFPLCRSHGWIPPRHCGKCIGIDCLLVEQVINKGASSTAISDFFVPSERWGWASKSEKNSTIYYHPFLHLCLFGGFLQEFMRTFTEKNAHKLCQNRDTSLLFEKGCEDWLAQAAPKMHNPTRTNTNHNKAPRHLNAQASTMHVHCTKLRYTRTKFLFRGLVLVLCPSMCSATVFMSWSW